MYNLPQRSTRKGRTREEPARSGAARDRYGDLDPYGHVNNAVYPEFFDPLQDAVQPRPDWFLPTVANLEGRSEASFSPEDR